MDPHRGKGSRLLATLVLAALLSACKVESGGEIPVPEFTGDRFGALEIATDTATGCQYVHQYRGGITPRLDRDGRQICDGERRP